MPSGIYERTKKGGEWTIDEAYIGLRTAVLFQAITDYWLSSIALKKNLSDKVRERRELVNKDAERFFLDPPFDYGDVDLNWVKRWIDCAVENQIHPRLFYNRYETR